MMALTTRRAAGRLMHGVAARQMPLLGRPFSVQAPAFRASEASRHAGRPRNSKGLPRKGGKGCAARGEALSPAEHAGNAFAAPSSGGVVESAAFIWRSRHETRCRHIGSRASGLGRLLCKLQKK